jgi:hypothetical protein
MATNPVPRQPECAGGLTTQHAEVEQLRERALTTAGEQLAVAHYCQLLIDIEFDRAEGETRR